jgi:hypothetical protein
MPPSRSAVSYDHSSRFPSTMTGVRSSSIVRALPCWSMAIRYVGPSERATAHQPIACVHRAGAACGRRAGETTAQPISNVWSPWGQRLRTPLVDRQIGVSKEPSARASNLALGIAPERRTQFRAKMLGPRDGRDRVEPKSAAPVPSTASSHKIRRLRFLGQTKHAGIESSRRGFLACTHRNMTA